MAWPRRAPDRRGRSARRPGAAAEGVLRRARPAAAQRHRQRRQLLAHAGPAHAPDDQRLARRADRARRLRARRGPGGRGAARAQRVPGRGRQHVRRAGARGACPSGSWTTSRAATRSAARATATCSCRPVSPTSCAPPSSSAAASGARSTSPAARQAGRSSSVTPTRSPPSPARSPEGIRASLRFDAARRGTGVEAPGLVVLGPRDEVELITPPARELLAAHAPRPIRLRRRCGGHARARARVVRTRRAPRPVRAANVVTVPGSDGWITLHASLPGPPRRRPRRRRPRARRRRRSATVRLEAFGATAREREVATLLARGLSRAEMAEALVLSPHTVEDHVKSLYEKLGVASRQELVARVFLDEYLPEVARQTPLDVARALRPRIARPERRSVARNGGGFAVLDSPAIRRPQADRARRLCRVRGGRPALLRGALERGLPLLRPSGPGAGP